MDFTELLDGLFSGGIDPVTFQYYNQLLNHRTIVLNYCIDEDVVEKVYLPLRDFEEDSNQKPVTLIMNCTGGSVADGFFLAHYLKNYKKKLNIIVPGYAASMAAIILCGGGKNPNITRYVYPSSYALIHDGYIAIDPSESKTAGDIMAFNNSIDEDIRDFVISNTKITPELYDKQSRHQWFIKADEMVELGLADKIIGQESEE